MIVGEVVSCDDGDEQRWWVAVMGVGHDNGGGGEGGPGW